MQHCPKSIQYKGFYMHLWHRLGLIFHTQGRWMYEEAHPVRNSFLKKMWIWGSLAFRYSIVLKTKPGQDTRSHVHCIANRYYKGYIER